MSEIASSEKTASRTGDPDLAPPAPRKRADAALLAKQTALVVVLLLVWEAAGAWLVNPFWSSRPSLIAERAWEMVLSGELWIHIAATSSEAGLGLLLGCVVGVALGLLMARFARATQVVEPLFMGLYSLPRVALAPLFVLWFGIGLLSKVMMSFSMVVFVFVLNVLEGVRSMDNDPIDLMRTMRASPLYITRRVLLPAVLPWIVAALRIGIGLSLVGSVVGELIGSSSGLGWYIEKAAGQLDTTGVFTGIVTLLVLAMLANLVLTLVFRPFIRWRQ